MPLRTGYGIDKCREWLINSHRTDIRDSLYELDTVLVIVDNGLETVINIDNRDTDNNSGKKNPHNWFINLT